jgi:hypothetical protein
VVALLLLTTAVGAFTGLGRDKGSIDASATTAEPSPETLVYFSQLRRGLSPLLLHVRALPATITALERARGVATTSQLNQAGYMAESFATARDLVGRLRVPPQAPQAVGELMQLSCELYRRSALALVELRTVAPGEAALVVVRRADALHVIGDRIIDQVRRVLAVDRAGADAAHIEYRYAPPVPDVAELTGSTAPLGVARGSVRSDLEDAAALLDRLSSGLGRPTADDVRTLTNVAMRLQEHAAVGDEPVVAARLAVLLGLLAADAATHGQGTSVDVLLMLSNDLWQQGRALASPSRRPLPLLPRPRIARSLVWTGGAFDGRPPPLKPGQDVGAGLPGGLPTVDTSKILRG